MKTDLFWDKSCKGKDKSDEMPHLWGNIVFCVLRPIMLIFRLNSKNKENLRLLQNKTGAVVIANHVSFLDVFCMYLSIRLKQWPRFIARENLWDHKALGFLLSRCGAFPIKRDTADKKAIKRAAKMLKNNEIVGIMPEGTRRGKSDKTPSLHAGAAFIARLGGNVPIIPCTTINAEKVKEKGKFVRFPKITVAFGDPILLEDFDFLPKEQRLEACTWYALRESFAMFYSCEPKEVDMVALFPENTDFTEEFNNNPIPKHKSCDLIKRK